MIYLDFLSSVVFFMYLTLQIYFANDIFFNKMKIKMKMKMKNQYEK